MAQRSGKRYFKQIQGIREVQAATEDEIKQYEASDAQQETIQVDIGDQTKPAKKRKIDNNTVRSAYSFLHYIFHT